LNAGMLRYGEHVRKYAKAFQRRPSDYYRASNGLLIATNFRIIFIGIAPTDKLENEDAPATIIQYEFPNDTMLTMDEKRLYFLTAHGVRISHGPGATQEFAASRGDEDSLDSLLNYVNRNLDQQRVEAIRETRIRKAVAKLIDEPLFYTVKRGDAISTVAARFDTTPDILKKLNNLTNNNIRIGQTLTVKAKGPRPELPPPPPPPAPRKTTPRGPKI
ncbi:MAG: LysM peptidoglycan-binding domain-containing protein, partial [Gemmatimonadaceae bacterium]